MGSLDAGMTIWGAALSISRPSVPQRSKGFWMFKGYKSLHLTTTWPMRLDGESNPAVNFDVWGVNRAWSGSRSPCPCTHTQTQTHTHTHKHKETHARTRTQPLARTDRQTDRQFHTDCSQTDRAVARVRRDCEGNLTSQTACKQASKTETDRQKDS